MKAASGPLPTTAGVGLPDDIIDIGDPAEVAKKLPQFEILEMLGRGGMGVVYKARQVQLDRLVALKILPPVDALSPDFVARFTREARALAKLNHPNIVNVYDFGETGGLYYIVMEYVEGANLRQLFEARKLTPAEALAIIPKICDALEYAHEEGLVHRDIKPENLLIDKKGRVKIADFGLAKLLRREPLDMTLTLSGMALGTLRYMAPEQMDKPESVDHRADLYSLGVVIYEMLTGETPVGRFELPSQKAQTDVRLDQIVLHALEREPARRYQHASEVRQDVEKVTSAPGPSATAVTQIAPPVGAGAGDATPVQLSPLPRFFWLRSFGLLMLGWGAVGALWNFGVAGFLLGSAVMAAIVLEMARTHANRNPRWVAKLRARGVVSRFAALFMNLAVLTLVFIILLGGLFTRWDSAAMGGNYFSPTSEEFEARYKGKEYQLIRRLSAFQEQVPTVELVRDVGVYSPGRMATTFRAWWFIGWSIALLFFIFQQAAGEEGRSIWSVRRGGIRPALACTGMLVGTMIFAYAALCVWTLVGSTGRSGRSFTTVNNTVVVQANLKQASDALHRWAAENGYESESTRWGVQTVPKGVQVARVEIFDAWKDSPFERWRMSASGLKRPFPHITAEIDGTDSPAQTEVMLYMGYMADGGMVEIGSAKAKQWRAIVNSLSEAVAKAGGVDPSNYIQKPPVKRPDGRGDWLAICGVLAAVLLWAFARAWSLRSVAATERGATARERKSKIPALLILACGLGIAGCLWPCRNVYHIYFGMGRSAESNNAGVLLHDVQEDEPAGWVGIKPPRYPARRPTPGVRWQQAIGIPREQILRCASVTAGGLQ